MLEALEAGKINAGRIRSMDAITAALFELLEAKPFARIAVTDICEKAGVARKTFYRNFESKIKVVERLVDQVFCEFMCKYDLRKVGARTTYLYWYEYILCTPEFASMFFDPDLYVFMEKKIREFVEIELTSSFHDSAAFDPLLSEYYLNFAAAGIVAIMREWMAHGCKTPAKAMAETTAKLLRGIVM